MKLSARNLFTCMLACALLAPALTAPCRDQNTSPFCDQSIWNTPIGSEAVYSPAAIFSDHEPRAFFSDDDYFIATRADDPLVDWYSQGWWGNPSGDAHCAVKGPLHGQINFPRNLTVTAFGNNNAAAILQPDNRTLVLTQPLYVCTPGAPVLSIFDQWHGTTDIRGNGTWGGHGGSSLSAIGGTIRLGELLPGAPPIRHALKLELFAHQYYYNHTPCYRWPALNCDGYALNCTQDPIGCYGGSNPLLTPGALLAVPTKSFAQLNASLATPPGRAILWALTYYGGYLVDDTYYDRGTVCTEHGVTAEFAAAWGFAFNAVAPSPFYTDMLAIFRALYIVASNGPDAIGGGGTPLQPPLPPFCDYLQ
eukprot:m.258133 g.258133  ORF g.258133 m.258133 type:complete len:364 (-) comp21324_c0_seq1:95-1186(-)